MWAYTLAFLLLCKAIKESAVSGVGQKQAPFPKSAISSYFCNTRRLLYTSYNMTKKMG